MRLTEVKIILIWCNFVDPKEGSYEFLVGAFTPWINGDEIYLDVYEVGDDSIKEHSGYSDSVLGYIEEVYEEILSLSNTWGTPSIASKEQLKDAIENHPLYLETLNSHSA